jgi:SnoaL-like domain
MLGPLVHERKCTTDLRVRERPETGRRRSYECGAHGLHEQHLRQPGDGGVGTGRRGVELVTNESDRRAEPRLSRGDVQKIRERGQDGVGCGSGDREAATEKLGSRAVPAVTKRSVERLAGEEVIEPLDGARHIVAGHVSPSLRQDRKVARPQIDLCFPPLELQDASALEYEMEDGYVARLHRETPRCPELGAAVDDAVDPQQAQRCVELMRVGCGQAIDGVTSAFRRNIVDSGPLSSIRRGATVAARPGREVSAMAALDVVQRYHDAWKEHDYETARSLLHDDLEFRGPFDTFDNADDFITAIRGLAQIVSDVRISKWFADGDDVCLLFELVTDSPAGTQPVAEWYRVRGEKIGRLQVYFDARPFAALRE